jgi:hypothetical protein
MNRKKLLIILGTAIVLITSGVAIAVNQPNTTSKNTKSSTIPFTVKEDPKVEDQPDNTIAITETTPATPEATAVDTEATDTPTQPQTPTTYFSASNSQYPGAGQFVLPSFTTTGDWTVNFSYTCDNGKAFAMVYPGGTQGIMMLNPSLGPFGTRSGHIKVVIPEGVNCTWNVSVS